MSDPATAAPAPDVEARLAAMKAEFDKEREAITAERAGLTALVSTVSDLASRLAPPPAPAPDPNAGLPTEEEWEQDRPSAAAKLSQVQIREALRAYDEVRGAEIAETRAALVDVEWERVRAEDPKNFGRLEATMRSYFQKNPDAKRPGAVRDAFIRLRGIHYGKLQEMDRAERQTEPIVDPAPSSGGRATKSTKVEPDMFLPSEVRVIKGLGSDPKHYFMAKHGREPQFDKGYLSSVGLREEA